MLSLTVLAKFLALAIVLCSVAISALPYSDGAESPYMEPYLNQFESSLSYQPRVRKAGHLSNMMRIGRSDPWMNRETRESADNNANSLRGKIWLLP
ncbi:hypothetical protein L596_028624 [Steinernema carpocapsae]|uniref:Neuropeptide-Like Protein n=1 Tax=Steinernema carpocapsae TaxID=34508 RepID=A0A4U5LYY1_STECR|nr:hypothetical protein L596_028624 [Steinernema carpocapsae]